MASDHEVLQYLENWKLKRFRPNEITFTEAAESLGSDEPLVVAQPGPNKSSWVLMNPNTDKIAILVFVGVWSWGSDLQTGNFVPKGKQPPDRTPADRIQHRPSFKCETTYTFDTSVDASIWEHIQIFEEHVQSQNGFNTEGRPRREWQSGKKPGDRDRYIFSSKLFVRRTAFKSRENGTTAVPYDIHPWISKAMVDFESSKQMPNPDRPQYYDFSEGVLRKLEETDNPRFNRDDIIIVSCKISFVMSEKNWWTEITPLELIRVDKLPEISSPQVDIPSPPQLDDDFTPLELGEPLELFEEHTKIQTKRKEIESEELDTAKRQRTDINARLESKVDNTEIPDASQPSSRPNLRSKPTRATRTLQPQQ